MNKRDIYNEIRDTAIEVDTRLYVTCIMKSHEVNVQKLMQMGIPEDIARDFAKEITLNALVGTLGSVANHILDNFLALNHDAFYKDVTDIVKEYQKRHEGAKNN